MAISRYGVNIFINDGKRLLIQAGDDLISILPANIASRKYVDRVTREINDKRMCEKIAVIFRNGHKAYLELWLDRPTPIHPDAIKEFQATCIMVYDL